MSNKKAFLLIREGKPFYLYRKEISGLETDLIQKSLCLIGLFFRKVLAGVKLSHTAAELSAEQKLEPTANVRNREQPPVLLQNRKLEFHSVVWREYS